MRRYAQYRDDQRSDARGGWDPAVIKTWDTEGFFIYPRDMRTSARQRARREIGDGAR